MNRIIFLIVIPTLFLIGCENRPYPTIELVGLNDTAFYTYYPSTDLVCYVEKKEYMHNPFYSITINKDTLSIGEDFRAYIGAYRKKYKIVIDSPMPQIFEGTFQEPAPGQPSISREYIYKTESEGIFRFKGQIEMDTLMIPFEYVFIVTKD